MRVSPTDLGCAFKGGKWQIVNKKQQIDDLYECNEVMLETWYDDYKDQYPEVIKSFQRYLKNKDESTLKVHIQS